MGRPGLVAGKAPRRDRRAEVLTARRNYKMATSVHAYVRGNTTQFYEWLASVAPSSFPQGPAIWICGDCHVGGRGRSRRLCRCSGCRPSRLNYNHWRCRLLRGDNPAQRYRDNARERIS